MNVLSLTPTVLAPAPDLISKISTWKMAGEWKRVSSLAGQTAGLATPIDIHVLPQAHGWEARWYLANIAASGDTQIEAENNLFSLIVDFARNEMGGDSISLSAPMREQQSVLRRFVRLVS